MPDIKERKGMAHGWWIACVLLLLAISFVFDMWGDKRLIREHKPVDPKYYSTNTVRHAFEKAETAQAGYQFECSSCHELMEPPLQIPKLIAEHEDIVLRHEAAMTCYTCHSRTNREVLNDIYGTEVAFGESENICRRCHGPHYRDWKLGIHGRVMGYWDKTKGPSTNKTCVSCHDPHAPKFPLMEPSPKPSRDHYITGGRNAAHDEPR
ncbi:MAG: hypothetical protein A3C36_05470 [Omnitrophica WOR_2 bacterium RIFCSPHIGHO2_02_FULL_52_10]|nr:MAG: hypothetical protein A3C36_05470 [Omnitrophica WOR_2 bacterium RIFCSPHIGHO2_02_FULL_52_10]